MANRFGDIPADTQAPQNRNRFGDIPADTQAPVAAPKDKQFYDDTLIGELGEGVASGLIGIGEGLAGLGAMGVDLIAGTDYGDKVTGGAEALRDAMGLDPEGFVGKGAEVITQFVIPGLGAASAVSKAAKVARAAKGLGAMSRAERFGLAAKELAAAGLADVAVSTDGMSTVSDWVGAGPLQTTDLIGLNAREKALARMSNRLKIGAESVLLGGVAQGALMGAGKTLGQVKMPRNVAAKIDQVGKQVDNLLEKRMLAPQELNPLQKLAADFVSVGRYRGYLPKQVAEKRLLLEGQIEPHLKFGERLIKGLDTEIDAALNSMPKGAGNIDAAGMMNRIEGYLTTADPAVKTRMLRELPEKVRPHVVTMRQHIDQLSQDVLGTNFMKQDLALPDGTKLKDVVEQNLGTYLQRRYKIFEDSKYVPSEESIKVARDFFRANRKATERELTTWYKGSLRGEIPDDFAAKNGLTITGAGNDLKVTVGSQVTQEAARVAQENFLKRYAFKNRGLTKSVRVAKDKLDTSMFIPRESVPKALRQLLGEIDDPRAAYLGTVADLAQFSAVDDYLGTVSQLAKMDSGVGKFFIHADSLTPDQAARLNNEQWVKLGGEGGVSSPVGAVTKEGAAVQDLLQGTGWGSLQNTYVPQEVYRDLTNLLLAQDDVLARGLEATFGTFLKLKGVSQYSKTVLSPITQVRNFSTAVSFALANGNVPLVGRGGSLSDAGQLVLANIRNRGPNAVFDALADAQRRGVVGTNAELREIQDILHKGLGLTTGPAPKTAFEAMTGAKIGAKVGKFVKPFEAIYQGSDDFWKFFNYNAEQAHLRHALSNLPIEQQIAYLTKGGRDASLEMLEAARRGDIEELIKARAAQIVRDTVPNYNKAGSKLVRFGRKMPVGNFISFPAEIFRTGFNIVKQGLDDMASDIPAIQARGRQRLMGLATVTAVVPTALLELAYATTGVGREEMDAYKRSFAPEWEKGSVLVPLGRTEDGRIEYINYSTSNPYDSLSRFVNRAINEADDAVREGKDPGQVLNDVAGATLYEFFQPFLSEAMLTEALVDVTFRGGRTSTGAEIYNPADNVGTKAWKKFWHVADTLLPNVVPINVSSGKPEPSRFLRGVLGSEDGAISNMDKMGRVRDPLGELARQVTGVSVQDFDPEKGLEFGAYRLGQLQTNAKRIFNRITDDANASSDQLYDAFVEANEAKFRIDREYYQMIKDLRDMGMTDRDIMVVLKKNNIGGVDGIMQGEFLPFELTRKNFQEAFDAGIMDRMPTDAIVQYYRDNVGRSLEEDLVEPRTLAPAQVPTYNPRFQGAKPSPWNSDSPAQVPTYNPRFQQQGAVNPALLGDNPIDQAANAQIAARLGRA